MPITIVYGEQRGDEAKGRFAATLAQDSDIVARFNGGQNAGHTSFTAEGKEIDTHIIPSGITEAHVVNVIGNGTVIDPIQMFEKEVNDLHKQGIEVTPENLLVSSAAHLVLPHHISQDERREKSKYSQGSTKFGISYAYSAKVKREGMRIDDALTSESKLMATIKQGIENEKEERKKLELEPLDIEEISDRYIENLRKVGSFVRDTVIYLNERLQSDGSIRLLAEGAQGFLLDVDHGMYPYTTSSSTGSNGVASGLGIPIHKYPTEVIGVIKAIQSHVGGGPFITEITDKKRLEKLHGSLKAVDAEVGTTTGRTRRLGALDIPGIRRAQMINGTDKIAISKLDWVSRLGEMIPVCISYTKEGKYTPIAPSGAENLTHCKPIYKKLPGWEEDIQGIRKFKDLPTNAQRYIEYIEEQIGIPITMIGVGPERDQVILRDN